MNLYRSETSHDSYISLSMQSENKELDESELIYDESPAKRLKRLTLSGPEFLDQLANLDHTHQLKCKQILTYINIAKRADIEEIFHKLGLHKWVFTEKGKPKPQKRLITFHDIRRILRLNTQEREKYQIDDLAHYFRNNQFFIDYAKENGRQNLRMIYQVMKFQTLEPNKYVIKYGEQGSKFYIILRGKASVRIPSLIEKYYSFRQIFTLIAENEEWIIQNDKFEDLCRLIQKLMPEVIKTIFKIKFNFKLAK